MMPTATLELCRGDYAISTENHPELQGLRRFLLATKDAHGLYARFGFEPLANPSRLIEVLDLHAYPPL